MLEIGLLFLLVEDCLQEQYVNGSVVHGGAVNLLRAHEASRKKVGFNVSPRKLTGAGPNLHDQFRAVVNQRTLSG